jgi:thiol-disulfide isomerase/thioredoxin
MQTLANKMRTIANEMQTIENRKVWWLGKLALTLQPEIFNYKLISVNMKKVLFMAALMLAALPTEAQQVKYSIDGISKENGKTVYLRDRFSRQIVDSAVVVNGKFSMSGNAEKDAYMGVSAQDALWSVMLFNDGTPVSINLNDSTLKGSPQNERLTRYDIDINASYSNIMLKVQSMSEEERKAKEVELTGGLMIAMMKMMTGVEKVFKEECETLIPVAFISEYQQLYGQQKIDSILATKPAWANHPIVQQQVKEWDYQKAQEEKKNAFIGQQFIDLEEADPDGNMHKLSEYVGKGKWVLVDFWASWCGPCKAEMPNVVAAYEKYHAKGFDIVGLSFDNKKEPWVKDIENLKMPWTHLSDLKGWNTVAAKVYGVNSIPDNLLIDPQGKIVARGLRAQGLQAKLKEIFGE